MAIACALFLAAAWAGPAAASVLYRCTGAGGETAYVSSTAGYRNCVKLGQWHTASVHRVEASQHTTHKNNQPSGTTLPGQPPRSVTANPAVLKITPLGDDDAVPATAPAAKQTWQPFPVVALDTLGAWVLPRVLGVDLAPERATPAPASSTPAPSATAPIPLKLEADKPTPPKTGAVYRVVQKNGTVLYTNVASLAQGHDAKMLFTYIVECYACNVHSKIDWNTVPLQLAAYGDDIQSAARLSGVNAALLRAIIHAESGFNPRALSYKGAQGLMQLMPGTAFELGVGDAFDPAQNISGGARYLALLLHDFHGDVKLAAAAYNAGAGAVTKYGGVPPYAETQVYVKRVAVLYQRYLDALAAHAVPTLATIKAGS
ncbi:MAG: Membrane-bound lytic murein transglycosylase D precursor [Rhodanobacteraceae bacterium]|jgi:soluble lytic murein transglycosylase-like protein|nr:MAG: Membrane-bound lytic murein transglycosylase D precursor [Rhodanobacteraceae bacterium]